MPAQDLSPVLCYDVTIGCKPLPDILQLAKNYGLQKVKEPKELDKFDVEDRKRGKNRKCRKGEG